MNFDEYSIQFIKGVGDKRAQLFHKLGVYTLQDLIHYYPRKYIDWSKTLSVKDAPSGEPAFIKATMITPVKEAKIRKGLTLYKCNFSDGEVVIHVTIFNNEYLAKSLRTFDDYILYGKVDKTFTEASMSSPQIERVENAQGIQSVALLLFPDGRAHADGKLIYSDSACTCREKMSQLMKYNDNTK